MSHHTKTMEAGAWTLLLAAIALAVYLLFHPKGQAAVTSRISPTKYPVIDSNLAGDIAQGLVNARILNPGDTCSDGTIYDNGNGQLWCLSNANLNHIGKIDNEAPPIYTGPFLV
jgi:hypothetical protein